MTPKASNDDSGVDVSGTSSLGTVEIVASPYFILSGWNGFCPREESGWIIKPSIAAQRMILRAIPGIVTRSSAEVRGWSGGRRAAIGDIK